jgi:hypothetical protein
LGPSFLRKNCTSVGHATSIRGQKEEQQKIVAEANKFITTPAKQQTVATEQEEVQAEQEDITQLYIGHNIIVKGLISSFIHFWSLADVFRLSCVNQSHVYGHCPRFFCKSRRVESVMNVTYWLGNQDSVARGLEPRVCTVLSM